MSLLDTLAAGPLFLGEYSKVAKRSFLRTPLFGNLCYPDVGDEEATKEARIGYSFCRRSFVSLGGQSLSSLVILSHKCRGVKRDFWKGSKASRHQGTKARRD